MDLFGLHDESSLVTALEVDHEEVLAELRRAEANLPEGRRPRKMHDDATVLTVFLNGGLWAAKWSDQ